MKELDELLFGNMKNKKKSKGIDFSIPDIDLSSKPTKSVSMFDDLYGGSFTKMHHVVKWNIGFDEVETEIMDFDQDGIPNFLDCQPFDAEFQDTDVFQKAVDFFGVTDDPREAGWILPSGEMLDFSGRKFDKESKHKRGMGHIDIGAITEQGGVEGINEFRRKGAVRYFKEEGGDVVASMEAPPTREQAEAIAKSVRSEPYAKYILLSRFSSEGPKERTIAQMESDEPHPEMVERFVRRAFPRRASSAIQAVKED